MTYTAAQPFDQLGLTSFNAHNAVAQSQKAFQELLKGCLKHEGLLVSEWQVLGSLYPSASVRPTDLAMTLGVAKPYVSTVVRRLRENGYLEGSDHAEDARSKEFRLTDKGRQLVSDIEPKLVTCLNRHFGGINDEALKIYFETAVTIAERG